MAITLTHNDVSTANARTEPGFGDVLRSEWVKLRSVRSTWIIFSLAIGLSIGFSAIVALVTGMTDDQWNDGIRPEFDPAVSAMGGWLFGMILTIVLGVTAVSSEYGSRMIRTTFIVNPNRTQVFAAKAIVVGLLGMVMTAIAVLGMFLVSQPIFRMYDIPTASITDPSAMRYLLYGGILHGLVHTLIPFSFTWLLRSAASAIAVSIGFSILPWMLTPLMPEWVQVNVFRFMPDYAKDSLIGVTATDSLVYISDFPASIAIAAWITGFLVVAAVVVNRRDV
jgi:ABC-2 type transport system permease protein